MSEQYSVAKTTLAAGGYTSGSGVLNVADSSAFVSPSRCYISDSSGDVVVILQVTAINSGTQLAVTAEGTDANASAGQDVVSCLTVGGENAIRADQSRIITGSLPSDGYKGDVLHPTDDTVQWVAPSGTGSGSAWNSFGPIYSFTPLVPGDFSWTNQGSATATARNGAVALYTPNYSGNNARCYEKAVPGSTPYSVIVAFKVNAFYNNARGGFHFRDSSSGKLFTFSLSHGTSWLSAQTHSWASVSSITSAPKDYSGGPSGLIWLKARNDGTNLTFDYSVDGISFVNIDTQTIVGTTGNAPTHWGFFLNANETVVDVALTAYSWAEGT